MQLVRPWLIADAARTRPHGRNFTSLTPEAIIRAGTTCRFLSVNGILSSSKKILFLHHKNSSLTIITIIS